MKILLTSTNYLDEVIEKLSVRQDDEEPTWFEKHSVPQIRDWLEQGYEIVLEIETTVRQHKMVYGLEYWIPQMLMKDSEFISFLSTATP